VNSANEKRSDPSKKMDGGDGSKPKPTKGAPKPEVGSALRSVYQKTVDEAVPADLLDLLGKLD
jgi:hypothetical protein